MKQLLLATAALVGMSAAALAAEPVALTDSQLDKVTAGQAVVNNTLPVVYLNAGAGILGVAQAAPLGNTGTITAGPTQFAATISTSTVTP